MLRDLLGDVVELRIDGCVKVSEVLRRLQQMLEGSIDAEKLVVIRNGLGLGKNDLVCSDDIVDIVPPVSGG